MMNIGTRPTVSGLNETKIEVNIFDFNKSIYDETIIIKVFNWIRPETKFDSIDALKEQFKNDKTACLHILGHSISE